MSSTEKHCSLTKSDIKCTNPSPMFKPQLIEYFPINFISHIIVATFKEKYFIQILMFFVDCLLVKTDSWLE